MASFFKKKTLLDSDYLAKFWWEKNPMFLVYLKEVFEILV